MKLDRAGKQIAKFITIGFSLFAIYEMGCLDQAINQVLTAAQIVPLIWVSMACAAFFFGWGWLTEEES